MTCVTEHNRARHLSPALFHFVLDRVVQYTQHDSIIPQLTLFFLVSIHNRQGKMWIICLVDKLFCEANSQLHSTHFGS